MAKRVSQLWSQVEDDEGRRRQILDMLNHHNDGSMRDVTFDDVTRDDACEVTYNDDFTRSDAYDSCDAQFGHASIGGGVGSSSDESTTDKQFFGDEASPDSRPNHESGSSRFQFDASQAASPQEPLDLELDHMTHVDHFIEPESSVAVEEQLQWEERVHFDALLSVSQGPTNYTAKRFCPN